MSSHQVAPTYAPTYPQKVCMTLALILKQASATLDSLLAKSDTDSLERLCRTTASGSNTSNTSLAA